jgi:hypothetical protein
MPRFSRLAAALIAVLALLAAVAGLRSSASAQAPPGRTLTFTELERGSTFTHIRNTKRAPQQSNLQGDVLAFTNPLEDAAGARVGKSSVTCITTTGARNFLKSTMTCAGVITLRDGTLTLQGNTIPRSRTTTVAVTGGTGAYANARGVYVTTGARGGSQTTITLVE